MMVIDIQGVGNQLTDPSLLSINGQEFGLGNTAKDGMDNFFTTHKCNHICSKLITDKDQLQQQPQLLASQMKRMSNIRR